MPSPPSSPNDSQCEEENVEFTEFQLETLSSHNKLRLILIFWNIFLCQGKTWRASDGAQCRGKTLVLLNQIGPLSSFLFCVFPSCCRQPIEGTFVKMCTYAQQWADQLLAENRFQHRCQPCEYWISITDVETLVTGMVSTANQQQPFINQKTLTIKQIINRHSRP